MQKDYSKNLKLERLRSFDDTTNTNNLGNTTNANNIGDTNNKTKQVDVEQINFSNFNVGKNTLDMKKYLYETGLQNIFNDYNQQIANLDTNKKREIEDAYYVRELSKKYLGEYSSNLGIGDVSGQLLDVYGKYQTNINEINANFNELQSGLESSYKEKKNEYELGLVQTQMEMQDFENKELLEKELSDIRYNLSTGLLPDGMDKQDYLDSVRDKIGEEAYWEMSVENKLVEMNKVVQDSLSKTNDYKNQGDWDKYVDSLLANKSINKQQADYMKGMYEVEQNTNFTKNNNININNDISYYNPDSLGIVPKGNVYESRGKDYILAETSNVVDSTSNLYGGIDEIGNEMSFNTPFAYNGKWFVKEIKNEEQVYTEYVKSQNYNKLTNKNVVNKNEQKEFYDSIHKELKGQNGIYGSNAYKYDKETGNYTQYLDFQASGIGGEKGNFNIGGVMYTIDKKYNNNSGGGIVDVKDAWKKGDWKKGFTDKHNAKAIVQEMIDNYFGGDKSKFSDYIEGSRKAGKNKITDENAIVVEYNGAYFTINDGELWELSKKK